MLMPSPNSTAFTAGTQVGDGKLYVDVDGAFNGIEVSGGNVMLVKNGEKAFDGGGTMLDGVLRIEAGTVGGVTLTDGATLDLSAFSETFSLDENAISFANGASITIALGSREIRSGTKLISWTTAPANLDTLTFVRSAEDSGSRYRIVKKDDGIYIRTGFMIIVK